jgi:beta-glucanase (GH16 family)
MIWRVMVAGTCLVTCWNLGGLLTGSVQAAPPPGFSTTPVWRDEFDGAKLDESKWTMYQPGARRAAFNVPEALSIIDGKLTITTFTRDNKHYSCMISTDGKFMPKYGYFEASIKFHDAPGEWSAFWVNSLTFGQPVGDVAKAGAEIDIVEHRKTIIFPGKAPVDGTNLFNAAVIWDGYGWAHIPPTKPGEVRFSHHTVKGAEDGFHRYGFAWDETGYRFYIDDVLWWTMAEPAAISKRPEYIILSSEVESNALAGTIPAAGYGSLATSTTKMMVDYVRVSAQDAELPPRRSAADDASSRAPAFRIRDRSVEPLLSADKPWESMSISGGTVIREGNRWRMWYGGYDRNYKMDDDACLCYAESPDGLRWTKPDLGLVEYQGSRHNNILVSGPRVGGFAFSYVFIDPGAGAAEKYKMIWQRFNREKTSWWVYGGVSADGMHWTLLPQPLSRRNSDTSTPCIPDGGKYRLYTRLWDGGNFSGSRVVGYTESDHFGDFPEPVQIFSHDGQDPPGMQFYSNAATKLRDRLYVMLPAAFYTKNQTVRSHLAWSRDGVHFTRFGRQPLVDVGTKFDSMGVYVMAGAMPGDAPNTWWFYYFGTKMEHDCKPADVKNEGGIGRFLLVVE